MKRDILGRELHDNDLVVVKGSGGYESSAKPMEVGVFLGKSVRTITGTRSARDMFLIENPGSMEVDLKNAILDKLAKEKAASAKTKAQRSVQKANVIGGIYRVARDNEVFLYCGKRKVTVYKNGVLDRQEIGHFYISGERFGRNPDSAKNFNFATFTHEFETRLRYGLYGNLTQKSIKNYETAYHTIAIPDKFEMVGRHEWKARYAGMSDWTDLSEDFRIVVELA